jgi:hypothetical protein
VLWIAFISVAFCLPELNPVSTKTLNYAPVAVGIVLTYALGYWTLSARTWFTGPIKQIAGAPRSLRYMRWLLTTMGSVRADSENCRRVDSAEPVVTSEKAEF